MSDESPNSLFPADIWLQLTEALNLSSREIQIIELIFRDEKEFAIALHLGISTHTVHTHLERLYRKLGVSSRLQLVVRLTQLMLQSIATPGHLIPPIGEIHTSGECPLSN